MQALLGNQMHRLDTSGDGNVSADSSELARPFSILPTGTGMKLSDGEFLVIRGILFDH